MKIVSEIVERVCEVPPSTKPLKDKRQDIFTDILLVVLIFGLGMWFRFTAYSWFFTYFIDSFDVIVQKESWFSNMMGWKLGEKYPTEGYFDLQTYYYPYVTNFNDGWNPYTGSRVAGDSIGGYVYGPFYIYFISFAAKYYGFSPHDSVMISNFIFDTLSAVMIYVLAKRVTGNVNAFVYANVYSLSPVVLYYFNVKLLNTPHMTFFTLVFIWFYLEHHDSLAIFFLTFAAMIKQFPLIYAMPVLLLLVRRYGWLRAIRFFFELVLYIIVLSYPYVVETPVEYVAKVLIGGEGKSQLLTLEQARNPALTGTTANLVYGAYFSTGDRTLDEFMFKLVNSHLLFYGSLFVFSVVAFSAYRILEARPALYLRFFAAYQFLAHGTIARGIFKYYDAYLMSLLLLAFVPDHRPNTFNIQLGKTLKRGYSILFHPKYRIQQVTRKYWTFALYLFISTVGILNVGYWGLSLFLEENGIRTFWSVVFTVVLLASLFLTDPEEGEKEIPEEVTVQIETLDSSSLIVDVTIWILAVSGILFLNNFIYSFFYNSFDVNLSSFSLLFVAIIPAIPALKKMSGDKWKNIDSIILTVSFVVLRFFFFPSYLYSNFVVSGVDLQTTMVTVLALALATILANLYNEFREIRIELKEITDENREIQIEKVRRKIKRGLDLSLLLLVVNRLLFIIDMQSRIFFRDAMQIYPQFVLGVLTIMILLWFSGDVLRWMTGREQVRVLHFEMYTFIFDTIFMLVSFWFFWRVNWMILNIDRLLGPTLIFAVGLVLIGSMGGEFFGAVIKFPARFLQEFRLLIKTDTTKSVEN